MRVAIIPFSDLEQSESLPVYRYFKDKNADITVFYWGNPDLPDDVKKVQINQKAEISGLEEYDLVVRGPSIHPSQIKSANNVTTLTNIFLENCPTKNTIGITGTKGKGTTSTLIAKILEKSGKKVWLGGNIGKTLLDDLDNIEQNDWVVLEMSNFQLIDLKYSTHIAVCLMIVPEHLDWHPDAKEYKNAKAQLFRNQSTDGVAIFNPDNDVSIEISSLSPGTKIPYLKSPGAEVKNDKIMIEDTMICGVDEIKLLGKHNMQNVCAAVTAVWQVTQDIEAIKSVITTFTGLEHRLEFVREFKGVKYYDDSFGTTPETAQVAIESFSEPKIVILGGSSKDANFNKLANTVAENNVKHVILIGEEADKIRSSLESVDYRKFSDGGKNMNDIIAESNKYTTDGDIVLLSTACASFDLFENYKDRGNKFKKTVQELS